MDTISALWKSAEDAVFPLASSFGVFVVTNFWDSTLISVVFLFLTITILALRRI